MRVDPFHCCCCKSPSPPQLPAVCHQDVGTVYFRAEKKVARTNTNSKQCVVNSPKVVAVLRCILSL